MRWRRSKVGVDVLSYFVGSNLEGGDVEILPEGQTQHVQVLTAVSKRTGQRDEDYREEEEESEREE